MGRNLTNLAVSESFQYLLQYSGSEVQDGLGSKLTGSLLITASKADTATTASYVLNAVSSSYSNNSTSASYALVSTSSSFATNANSASYATTTTSASYANNAASASYAVTASFALNGGGATVSTASLLTTASAAANVITFTKGDGSTFNVTVAQSGSVATASLALNNVLTASVSSNTITFTKGDGTTFPITVNTGSAVTINTGSLLVTASISNATTTFTKGDGSTFNITANNVVNATSASVATSASFATTAVSASYSNNSTSASYALNATSASFASTIPNGLSPTFNTVTASNVLITGTASVNVLITNIVSSSVIFTSGSNQLGDNPTLDTQTLFGAVKVTGSFASTGSAGFTGGDFKVTDQARNAEFDVDKVIIKTQGGTQFTGSVSSQNGFTGSLQGTASYATNALSSSYSNNSTSASYAATSTSSSFAINATSASYALNSTSASYSNNSTSSSFANNATSASFAITASYALNAGTTVSTASLLVTASATNNVITFTKGDASTFNVTVNTGSAPSAFPFSGSAVITGSLLITGSSAHTLNVSGSNILVGGVDEGKQATVGIVGSRYGFAGGWLALSSMTGVDRYNVAIGGASMYNATTNSDRNVAVGASTIGAGDFNNKNVAIGHDAMSQCSNSNENVFVGEAAGVIAQGSYNVGVGWNAGRSTNTGFGYNTTIGWYSMGDAGGPNCYGNVALGYTALRYASRYYNTAIGAYALDQLTTGEDNTVVGLQAGHNLTTGNRNVFLGRYAGYNETASDRLHIANTQSYSLIYGEFDNRLVKINGDLQVVSGSVSGSVITNATSNYSASKVDKIVTLTQAEYNGLTPNANTLYIISGSTPNATIGSNTFSGSQVFSGSVRGQVNTLSISSNTASLDCSTNNFFTLSLVSGSTTFINPSNVQPGQTINIKIQQPAVSYGSISFPATVKQASGATYTPTTSANAVDIITLISFDSTDLYLSNIKNLITPA